MGHRSCSPALIAVTSALMGPLTSDAIDLRICLKLPCCFESREGFVVIPSIKPVLFNGLISLISDESKNIFIIV